MVQTVKSNPFLRQMTSNQAYRVNPQPKGFSSLGQQMNAQNLMGMANNEPRGNTPPNFKNNLLNYIISPRGKGMAQGLLESSGYSTKPVGMGEALARGLARSNESQRYADETAFKKQQYEDTKDFRDTQTSFQNKMMESEFGLKERKFLSDEELALKGIGLTEEQIINAKENNVNLLAFKNKKLTQDELLALKGLGLEENQINNLENYRTNSLEFQNRKLTSDEKISLAKLDVDKNKLSLQGIDIDNRWKLGLKNVGLKQSTIDNLEKFRSNQLLLEQDKFDFSKGKFGKETTLALKKLGIDEKRIEVAEKYNEDRIRLQGLGLDIEQIKADAMLIKAQSTDNRTSLQKNLDSYASIKGIDNKSTEYQELYKELLVKPASQINLAPNKNLKSFEAQLSIVTDDRKKYESFNNKTQSINQMEAGLDTFKSGAFGDTRIFVGEIGDLLGFNMNKDEYFNPEGQLINVGAAAFKRDLANGLQNLNKEELKMLEFMNPRTANAPSTNRIILDTMKVNNKTEEKLFNLTNEFIGEKITYNEYATKQKTLKKEATIEANKIYETYTQVGKGADKVLKDFIGDSTGGFDVNNNPITVKVEASDKWTGQTDRNGSLVIRKDNGVLYAISIEE